MTIMTKRIVVTGGSSGIGLAIVQSLLNQGNEVFNLDIQVSDAVQQNSHPSDQQAVNFMHCDVTDHERVKACIDQIGQDGPIDALVCSAGKHVSASIEETEEATLTSLFNLNVKGAYSATQTCLKYMKGDGGSIVYVASDQSLIGKRNSFAYNLTKHALASMAKTTALDYADFNIRANAVCPGTIDTPLYQHAIKRYCERSGVDEELCHAEEAAAQPIGRIGKAEEVASLVAYLISDEASFITGSLQVIDGGYTAQ